MPDALQGGTSSPSGACPQKSILCGMSLLDSEKSVFRYESIIFVFLTPPITAASTAFCASTRAGFSSGFCGGESRGAAQPENMTGGSCSELPPADPDPRNATQRRIHRTVLLPIETPPSRPDAPVSRLPAAARKRTPEPHRCHLCLLLSCLSPSGRG